MSKNKFRGRARPKEGVVTEKLARRLTGGDWIEVEGEWYAVKTNGGPRSSCRGMGSRATTIVLSLRKFGEYEVEADALLPYWQTVTEVSH